jgi:hypothetical protein
MLFLQENFCRLGINRCPVVDCCIRMHTAHTHCQPPPHSLHYDASVVVYYQSQHVVYSLVHHYVFLTRWQYLVKNNATIPIINHDDIVIPDSCDEFYCVLLCVFCNRRQLPANNIRNHHNEIRGARCYHDDFTKL